MLTIWSSFGCEGIQSGSLPYCRKANMSEMLEGWRKTLKEVITNLASIGVGRVYVDIILHFDAYVERSLLYSHRQLIVSFASITQWNCYIPLSSLLNRLSTTLSLTSMPLRCIASCPRVGPLAILRVVTRRQDQILAFIKPLWTYQKTWIETYLRSLSCVLAKNKRLKPRKVKSNTKVSRKWPVRTDRIVRHTWRTAP